MLTKAAPPTDYADAGQIDNFTITAASSNINNV